MQALYIDPAIEVAETMPAKFYTDAGYFEHAKEAVFAKSWQWIGDAQGLLPLENSVHPHFLLEHFLDEPMVLARGTNDTIQNLSNVCTHRGNLIVHHPGKARKLTCLYHGRRFGIDGAYEFMPEFKEVKNFPRPCDHLHSFPLARWANFLFTSIDPAYPIQAVLKKMQERVGFLPLEEYRYDAASSKDYLVHAHWALYCDNYLEGFHIPFVHSELNSLLDYGNYTTELDEFFNLQVGYASSGSTCFDLPEGHPDYGQEVAAYYYWLFPNLMFNFYPWGLSINVVKPISPTRTKVSFLTYVHSEVEMDPVAAALTDKVEREDEFVVEGVQRGIRSRVYDRGRYSATRERGVHHFHCLLARFMNA